MKRIIFITSLLLVAIVSNAQIGYQVSLLNTATGEPRANVSVNATVTITDSADGLVYTGTQQATTNDFGVLSLTIGDAETFKKADCGKLPFFISVSVDGTLIGKSQILSVPVAEYASQLKSTRFTKQDLVGTWKHIEVYEYEGSQFIKECCYNFKDDGTFTYIQKNQGIDHDYEATGVYEIQGNNIYVDEDYIGDGPKDECWGYRKPSERLRYIKGRLYSPMKSWANWFYKQ